MIKYFCGVPRSGKTTKAMAYAGFEATNLKDILRNSGYATTPNFYNSCTVDQLVELQTKMMARLSQCNVEGKVYDRAALDGLVYSAYYGVPQDILKDYLDITVSQKGQYYIHLHPFRDSEVDELGLHDYYRDLASLYLFYGKKLISPGNEIWFID